MKKILLVYFYLLCIQHVLAQQPCTSTITSYPSVEDFESDNGGWTTGGINSDWEWGSPSKRIITRAGSGQNCWITGGLTRLDYNDNQQSWLLSPCYDFSNLIDPELSFNLFWETEREFDGASLQYTLDNGRNWSFIGIYSRFGAICERDNWYNAQGIFSIFGWRGWAGNQRTNSTECNVGGGAFTWRIAKHVIHDLGGKPNVRFRFYFGSNSDCNKFDGFAFDDFTILESPAVTASFLSTCKSRDEVEFRLLSQCALSYAWTFGDPASGINNASTLAVPTHKFSAPGSYTVSVTAQFLYGAPRSDTKEVVIIKADPVINWPGACSNIPDASLSVTASGSPYPYNYTWNTNPVQLSSTINSLGPGNYSVAVTSNNSCTANVDFVLNASSAIAISSTTDDATCTRKNGKITTNITGGALPHSYTWSNGANTASISNLSIGNYSLIVTDANGCPYNHKPQPVKLSDYKITVNIGQDRMICPGQTWILSPGYFAKYLWQDGSTGSTFKLNRSGQYHVLVTDANGCEARDTINITGECIDIYFPSAFSPNMDNINDEFGPIGNLPALVDFSMSIYDRWGERIYYTTDPYKRWDGTFKNTKPDSGSYIWVSEFTFNGKKETRKGGVTLIR